MSDPVSVPLDSLWRPAKDHPHAIEVNLGFQPEPPFARTGSWIDWWWGQKVGWVLLEKQEDGELYQDGRKVVGHLEPEQVDGGFLRGVAMRDRLSSTMRGVVLHPNIGTALVVKENQRLIPESWKGEAVGDPVHLEFWALGFRDGGRFVANMYWNWDFEEWRKTHDSLGVRRTACRKILIAR